MIKKNLIKETINITDDLNHCKTITDFIKVFENLKLKYGDFEVDYDFEDDDYNGRNFYLIMKRLETDEEFSKRCEKIKKIKEYEEKSEKELYEKLKRKYG